MKGDSLRIRTRERDNVISTYSNAAPQQQGTKDAFCVPSSLSVVAICAKEKKNKFVKTKENKTLTL